MKSPKTARSAICALFVSVLAGVGCGFSCEDELILATRSPKGPQELRVFVRNCGATSPYVTWAQAREPGILGGWTDVVRIVGRPVVEARWPSVSTAIIAYGRCAPGEAAVLSSGSRNLTVLVREEPTLGTRCAPNGYWYPEPRVREP